MKKETKEKIAYCGSLFLGAVGAVTMAAGTASMAHAFTGMEIAKIEAIGASLFAVATIFSAGASALGEAKKPNWVKRSQGLILGLSFCGASVLTGSDSTVIMQDDVRKFSDKVTSTTPPEKKDLEDTISFSDYAGRVKLSEEDNLSKIISRLCSCAENYQKPSDEDLDKSPLDFLRILEEQKLQAS